MRFRDAALALAIAGFVVAPASAQAAGADKAQPAKEQEPAGTVERTLSPEMVKQIQKKLNDEGYSAGDVDGVFGAETREALKDFQQKKGLKATGYVDKQTMAALGIQAGGGGKQAEQKQQKQQKQGGDAAASPGTKPKSESEQKK